MATDTDLLRQAAALMRERSWGRAACGGGDMSLPASITCPECVVED